MRDGPGGADPFGQKTSAVDGTKESRWRIEHDYRELKTTLGLDHFEGRSFTGWHRHVTLVTAAHLFLTEQRTCPKAPARA